ncbi:hypothetical protein [Streptomyces sp. NPDC001601]
MDQIGLQVRRADRAEVALGDHHLDLGRVLGRRERQRDVGVQETQECGIVAVHDGEHRHVQRARESRQNL